MNWYLAQKIATRQISLEIKAGNFSCPAKEDVPCNTLVRIMDEQRNGLGVVYGNLDGDTFTVEYAHLMEEFRGQGVYTEVLRQLQGKYHVVSDEDHNNAASKIYQRLGAEHLLRYNRYQLPKRDA